MQMDEPRSLIWSAFCGTPMHSALRRACEIMSPGGCDIRMRHHPFRRRGSSRGRMMVRALEAVMKNRWGYNQGLQIR